MNLSIKFKHYNIFHFPLASNHKETCTYPITATQTPSFSRHRKASLELGRWQVQHNTIYSMLAQCQSRITLTQPQGSNLPPHSIHIHWTKYSETQVDIVEKCRWFYGVNSVHCNLYQHMKLNALVTLNKRDITIVFHI